jgi:tRNA threonylcarbamoyladenosine biosynthesis protein TsaB
VSSDQILAIDTTTAAGGVVIASSGRPLARIEVETRAAVSELVVALVRDALSYVGLRPDALARIVVSRGPGSFTGIRVGLATARALGMGWGRPVFAVTAFESVHAHIGAGGSTAVLLDARRGQIYAALVGKAAAPDPVALDPRDLPAWAASLGDVRTVAGSALGVHAGAVARAFPHAVRRPDVVPSALGVALADAAGFARGDPAPLYVRPADARLPREEGS